MEKYEVNDNLEEIRDDDDDDDQHHNDDVIVAEAMSSQNSQIVPYFKWFPWITKFSNPALEEEYATYLGNTTYGNLSKISFMQFALSLYFAYELYASTTDPDRSESTNQGMDWVIVNPAFWFSIYFVVVVIGFQVYMRKMLAAKVNNNNSKKDNKTSSSSSKEPASPTTPTKQPKIDETLSKAPLLHPKHALIYELSFSLIFLGAVLCHSYLRHDQDELSDYLPMHAVLTIAFAQLTLPRTKTLAIFGVTLILSTFAWTFSQTSSHYTDSLCAILVALNMMQVLFQIIVNAVIVEHPMRENFIQRCDTLAREGELVVQKDITLSLLKNILPVSVVKRLQSKELQLGNVFERFSFAAVLFADIAGFTQWSSSLDASFVGDVLHHMICLLDKACAKTKCEKVKTVGDAYWAVAGVPDRLTPGEICKRLTKLACGMPSIVREINSQFGVNLGQRVGVHCGPLTGGIIGKTKFSYDVWGQTMSRCVELEANGVSGKVHISQEYRDLVLERRSLAKKYIITDSNFDLTGIGQLSPTYFIADPSPTIESLKVCNNKRPPPPPPPLQQPTSPQPSTSSAANLLWSPNADHEDNGNHIHVNIPGQVEGEGERNDAPENNTAEGEPKQSDEEPEDVLLCSGDLTTLSEGGSSESSDGGTTLQDLIGDRGKPRATVRRRLSNRQRNSRVVASNKLINQDDSDTIDEDLDSIARNSCARLSTVGSAMESADSGSNSGGNTPTAGTGTPKDQGIKMQQLATVKGNHSLKLRRRSSLASWNSRKYDNISLRSEAEGSLKSPRLRKSVRSAGGVDLGPPPITIEQLAHHPNAHQTSWTMGFINPDEETYYRNTQLTQKVEATASLFLGNLLDVAMLLLDFYYNGLVSMGYDNYVMFAVIALNVVLVIWVLNTTNHVHFSIIQWIVSITSTLQFIMYSIDVSEHDEIMLNRLFYFIVVSNYILTASRYRFYWGCGVILVLVQSRIATLTDHSEVITEAVGLLACAAIVSREWTSRQAFVNIMKGVENEQSMDQERVASDLLLNVVLPPKIAQQLREDNKAFIYERYTECTVLFAEVVGFDDLLYIQEANDPTNMELSRNLNKLFSKFDDLCALGGVEKIKSIGSIYLAVAGAPDIRSDHAAAVFGVALHMRKLAQKMVYDVSTRSHGRNEEQLRIRIGVHTGPLVGGVLGRKNFAFDIFGDTVNTASRLMSTCKPGGIQVSQDTHQKLPRGAQERYSWTNVSLKLKGKGQYEAWLNEEQ
eukprot:PhF_6_TR42926/c1_g1_i2/m.65113